MKNTDLDNETTTVAVKKSTYKKLQKICLKVESYDELINRLMRDEKEKTKGKKASYEDAL